MSKWLIFAARVVNVCAIAFIGMFSLDVFSADADLARQLIGFAIHNIPNLVLIALMILAWFRPLAGGLLTVAISLLPLFFLSNPVWVNLILGAPFMLTGLLYLAGHYFQRSSAQW